MIASPRPIQDPARRHGVALAVALILLVSTALRLWQLGTPAEMMFDEIYYAKDGKAIVDGRVGPKAPLRWAGGDEVSWPHPEMGKFAIAAGIKLFGDRAFGWRLPAVVAGVALLACVYPLGRRLGLSPPWALLALLFAAADPLGIAQSRIATLDIFIAAWTAVCVLFALRYVQDGWRARWLLVCGAAGGMALATKWSGALAIIAAALIILVSWILQRRAARGVESEGAVGAPEELPKSPAALTAPGGESVAAIPPEGSVALRVLTVIAALVAVPLGIYLLSYAQYFATVLTRSPTSGELHRQMLTFNLNLDATHTYASAAYTWMIDYRPVWYFFEGKTTYHGVVAIGNPFLWWLAIPLAARRRGPRTAEALLRAAAGGGPRPGPLRAVVRHHEDVLPLLHDAGGAVHGDPRRRRSVPRCGRRDTAPWMAGRRRGGSRDGLPVAPGRNAAGWPVWTLQRRRRHWHGSLLVVGIYLRVVRDMRTSFPDGMTPVGRSWRWWSPGSAR